MIIEKSEIAIRQTLPAIVGIYKQACADIISAYELLEKAQGRLRSAFCDTPGHGFTVNDRNNYDRVGKKASDHVLIQVKKDAWRHLTERMELRRALSLKRRDELDKQLDDDKQLPEVTEENIVAMFEMSVASLDTYLEEAVKEVFDYLRPPGSKYKTNTEFELGKRVILGYAVEKGWSKRGKFRPTYNRDKYLTAIDNVFSMIDGKGAIKTHYGQLYDAIIDSHDGRGETDYFSFKCFLNGNLHIEFLRPDLVAKLNAVAGGARLRQGTTTS